MTSRRLPTPDASDRAKLSYSQADFPANHSLVPESEKERQMTATSGRICYESSKSFLQDGLLRKMSEVLLTSKTYWNKAVTMSWKMKPIMEERTISQQAHLFASSMTSNKQVIQSKYFLYQLAVKAHPIAGTDCGLLGTPRVVQSERSEEFAKGRVPTATEALSKINQGLLLTPSTVNMEPKDRLEKRTAYRESIGRHYVPGGLSEQIAMLPTATSRDYKGSSSRIEAKGRNPMTNSLCDAVESGQNSGLKLHSDFVSWMQGYPIDWLDIP